MSKAALKKVLKDMDASQLREVICELYEVRPEAKEYLEFWINPDLPKESEKYKLRIYKLFFISEGRPRKSPDFKELKTQLKYFSTLGVDSECLAELHLYAFEIYSLWLTTRNKVMSHEKRVETYRKDIEAMLDKHGLENIYGLRFQRAIDEFDKIFHRGDLRARRGWRRWLH